MKRGLTARAAHDARQRRRQRARARPLRIGHIEHDQIGGAAEQLCGRGKAADEGRIFGAFEKIAAGIVARRARAGRRSATRCANAPGAAAAFAASAAIAVRGGGEIGGADRFAVGVAAEQILDAGAVGAGRRAEDAIEPRRRPLRAVRPASGFSSSASSRAATACTAASISAICAGKRSRNSPEMRQVTSTRARPDRGGRQHFDAGDAAAGMIPDRPAAHQRKTLRDLLAAGAQSGAAPQIDHHRARHARRGFADARARLRRRRAGRAPSRSVSAACADRR